MVGADLLFSGASNFSMGAALDQMPIAAEQLADSAAAPSPEEGKSEETESALALPEAESVGEAEDGLAQGFYRSDDQAAGEELAEESAAAPAAGGPPAEGIAEPGKSEFTDESPADLETRAETDQDALKAAADEGASEGRLAAAELEFSDEKPSVSFSLLRGIEIGLAAALVVLIGLTLWVR